MNDTFYTTLQSLLDTNHFEKQSDNVYILKQQKTQPGSVVNINGRVMQQPNQVFNIIYELTTVGDGWCSNSDDTNKKDISFIKFVIKQVDEGEDIILMEAEMGFYYEDIEELDYIFNKFIQS